MNLHLHSTKGVNPRITVCTQCGEDLGIALLGIHEGIYECISCGQKQIGHGRDCPSCKVGRLTKTGTLPERAKIPDGLCDKCKKLNEACKEVVESGGVYWQCSDCHSMGAIKAKSAFSQKVRASHKMVTPDGDNKFPPCGVEFNKDEGCPVCSKSVDGNEKG